MPLIKPGKINFSPKDKRRAERGPTANTKARLAWNDFEYLNKAVKLKEYEPAGNRMVPRSNRNNKDANHSENQYSERDYSESDRRHARTDYEFIEEKIGYTFKNRSDLAAALTHRSALGFKERADYERLEFLGDAVLDLAVADLLIEIHPEAREGELSKMRAALVNTQALAAIAKRFELGPFIKLGRGENSSGGQERPSILADVIEAIVGAMYRDGGFDRSIEVIRNIFGDTLKEVTPFDPKTELQELLHAAGSEPPEYLLEMVEGPEHQPTFVTVVIIDGEIAGRGKGPNKKAAQQFAAAKVIERMFNDSPAPVLQEGQDFFIPEALLIAPPVKNTPIQLKWLIGETSSPSNSETMKEVI
jgi:ribonuclease-3